MKNIGLDPDAKRNSLCSRLFQVSIFSLKISKSQRVSSIFAAHIFKNLIFTSRKKGRSCLQATILSYPSLPPLPFFVSNDNQLLRDISTKIISLLRRQHAKCKSSAQAYLSTAAASGSTTTTSSAPPATAAASAAEGAGCAGDGDSADGSTCQVLEKRGSASDEGGTVVSLERVSSESLDIFLTCMVGARRRMLS